MVGAVGEGAAGEGAEKAAVVLAVVVKVAGHAAVGVTVLA